MQNAPAPTDLSRMRRFLEVVRLRYTLQWAQIRASPWRIVWFGLVQATLLVAAVVFGLVGLGSLIAAVESGRGTPLVQAILGGVFLNAVVASLIFGFGLGAVFSDRSLRRYPFSRRQRFFIRHLLGLFEPLWLIALAAYGGAAFAAVALGIASFPAAVVAALLLMIANYLLVRLVLGVGTLLLQTTAGSLLLFAGLQSLFILPMSMEMLLRSRERRAALRAAFESTPPAAAGALLTGAGTFTHLLVLLGWCAVGIVFLAALDRRGDRNTSVAAARATWNSPVERLTSFLPAAWAPLVLRGLRFYMRSYQVRLAMLTMLPFLVVWPRFTRAGRGGDPLALTLLLMPVLGSVTSALVGNSFGFDAGGTRRLLLAPVRTAAILGGTLGASLVLSAAYVALATAVILMLSREVSAATTVLLLTHGLSGMFLYHSLAVWTSVIAPFKADYTEKFRRQTGGAAQLLMLVFIAFLALSFFVRRLLLPGPVTDYWWLSTIVMLLSGGLFVVSLRLAAPVLMRRRERLLAIVEGRK